MSTPRHTPGPWSNDYPPATGFGCGYGKSQIIDNEGRPLAGVAIVEPKNAPMYNKGSLSKEAFDLLEANARLIAAAPELLEACAAALVRLQEYEIVNDYHHPLVRQLQRAIAKARGQE